MDKRRNRKKRGFNRIVTVLLAVLLCLVYVPPKSDHVEAARFSDINASEVFLKQSTSYTCTLVANVMMLRRDAMIKGDGKWNQLTESSCKSTLWTSGGQKLNYSYRYPGGQVANVICDGGRNIFGNKSASYKENLIRNLLNSHPEGVVVYDYDIPHAILITDYTNGIFYCADPARNKPSGRIPMSSSSVKISNCESYWYVTNPGKLVTTPQDTTKPKVWNAKISNVTSEGYDVSFNVSDNVGVSRAEAPTWTANNGQDDLIWHRCTVTNGVARFHVKTSDHKNESGLYITHCYAWDAVGNGGRRREIDSVKYLV